MKIATTLLLLALSTLPASAGNWFGSGPWANGAYYPGQFDGVYSATMFGGTPQVVSGVLGFGLRNGSPTTLTNIATTATNAITVDPSQNYFVVFLEGRTFAGVTVAAVNNDASNVSGGLFNGVSQPTFTTLVTTNFPGATNQTVTVTTLSAANTCSGGFNASLTGKKAVITFSGNNTGRLRTSLNGTPTGPTNSFSLSGLKVGNQTAQANGR
jgi:hypothetical protein